MSAIAACLSESGQFAFLPIHDIHDGRSCGKAIQRGDERVSEDGERGRGRECPGLGQVVIV